MVVPPNIEQLRESLASGLMYPGPMQDATYIPEYDDAISDALDWLLSVLDDGGKLVVELARSLEGAEEVDTQVMSVDGFSRCVIPVNWMKRGRYLVIPLPEEEEK